MLERVLVLEGGVFAQVVKQRFDENVDLNEDFMRGGSSSQNYVSVEQVLSKEVDLPACF